MDKLVEMLSRWPHARRYLTAAGVALLAVAVVLLGYPVYTDVVHNSMQARLRAELTSPGLRAEYLAGDVRSGQSLTRIQIPKINLDVVVVQGTDAAALQAGAGHYAETPLPCGGGNVAIAGHRTTYGKPFANVGLLGVGDQITLITPIGSCVYRVSQAPFVVLPNDWGVVANTPGDPTLTLTSCAPKGSASHRIVIKAQMVSSETTI
ncbi:MAG: class E sortase [Acidimicrobiales bacterium]